MLSDNYINLRAFLIGLIALLSNACTQIVNPPAGVANAGPTIEYSIPNEVYYLRPGDKVSMIVVQKNDTHSYRINSGDEIEVYVQDRDELSVNYLVGPDGTLPLRHLSPIYVVGKTLEEVQKEVIESYKSLSIDAVINVSFKRFNASLSDFTKTLSPSGAQINPFITTIEIDGKANFPLVGVVEIANKTLREADEFVSEKVQAIFPNADITLRIEDSPRRSIAIIGAVTNPGTYPVTGAIPFLSIVAAAKGYTDEANLDSIITLQPRIDKLYINKIDLQEDILSVADMKMLPGDIIYIPKQRISNINRFVDQYVRKNIPLLMNLPLSGLL